MSFVCLFVFSGLTANGQTQVTNTAVISPPPSVTNTNSDVSCSGGVCSAADSDSVTPSRPLVSKNFSVPSISSGGTALLTITITNTHALVSATLSTTFTDTYGPGLINFGSVATTSCSPGTASATIGLGTVTLAQGTVIPPNASCLLSVVVTNSASGTLTNTIPSGSLATSVGSNSATVSAFLSVSSNADLTLSKVISTTGNATQSSVVSYTVTLVNSGLSAAQNVTLTDLVSAGLTIQSAGANLGVVSFNASGATVTLASLAANQTITLTLTALVTAGSGNITNNAAATSITADSNTANNTATVVTPVASNADLTISKVINGPAVQGTTVTYTVTLVNLGPSTAVNVVISDVLSTGLGYINAATNGSVAVANAAQTTTAGTASLAVGQTLTLSISASVLATTGNVTNTAVGTSTTPDPNPGNTATVVTPVVASADLTLTKVINGPAVQGSTVSYTVTVVNLGPSSALNVQITDILSAGLSFISASTSGNVAAANSGQTTTAGTAVLALGQTLTLVVNATVTASSGDVTNTAGVSSPTPDPTGTNTVVVVTPVRPPLVADVTTQVTVPSTVSASSVVSGSVIFSNIGGLPASNVGGTVTFSAGVQIQAIPPGAVTATVAGLPAIIFPSTLSGLGTVNPGISTSFAFTIRTPGLIGNYGATSTVATTTPEVTTVNNFSVAPMVIDQVPSNAVLSGRVYQDLLRNKVFDSGVDLPIANFRVELIRVTATGTLVIASATTATDGTYRITDLTPGTGYAVRFFDGSGSVIFGTPFNQQSLTLLGNISTGSNALTSPNTPSGSTPLSTLIENITLYAGDNVQQQNLPLDPSGVVYDSVTRKPLVGATVRLVYEGPGVFSPANQTLQGTDTIITSTNGMYQYLFINNPPAGVYRFDVTPTAGYQPPQATLGGVIPAQGVLNANLGVTVVQPLGTAPAVGVIGGAPVAGLIGVLGTQYYLRLQLNFPGFYEIINNHVPLDALNPGALLVSKTGNKTVAEIGDSVQYTVRIRNTTLAPISNIKLNDLLPAGFRYILGTAQLGGVTQVNPAGGVGRELTFDIGAIAGQATAELSYFVRLGVGSQQGDGINRATVVAPIRSNTAVFKVNVQGGVFSNEGCIAGKVYVDCDGNAIQNNVGSVRELGIPGVRLVMLDGTFVITDSEGKYSICGVKSQTHVVKVDRTTLPKGSRLVPSSNRNAGVGDSLFVDLKGGELARADFIEGSCSPEVLDQVKARRAQGGVSAPDVERVTPLSIDNRTNNTAQSIPSATRQQNVAPASAQGGK